MVVENNEVFYFEGNITGDHLHIDIFRIQPRYRGEEDVLLCMEADTGKI